MIEALIDLVQLIGTYIAVGFLVVIYYKIRGL
jgi:hypothetical protein